jgi:hypothetical protein
VAALAGVQQILVGAILRNMVEMRNRENDERACYEMSAAVNRWAPNSIDYELAAIARPFANARNDLLPLFWIARFIFGTDGHR